MAASVTPNVERVDSVTRTIDWCARVRVSAAADPGLAHLSRRRIGRLKRNIVRSPLDIEISKQPCGLRSPRLGHEIGDRIVEYTTGPAAIEKPVIQIDW